MAQYAGDSAYKTFHAIVNSSEYYILKVETALEKTESAYGQISDILTGIKHTRNDLARFTERIEFVTSLGFLASCSAITSISIILIMQTLIFTFDFLTGNQL